VRDNNQARAREVRHVLAGYMNVFPNAFQVLTRQAQLNIAIFGQFSEKDGRTPNVCTRHSPCAPLSAHGN
jgi:hypothetical protein